MYDAYLTPTTHISILYILSGPSHLLQNTNLSSKPSLIQKKLHIFLKRVSLQLNMDGDHTAKTFEQGANSALKDTDMSQGIHETVKQTPAAGEKTQGTGTSVFDKTGAVGSMFNCKLCFHSRAS